MLTILGILLNKLLREGSNMPGIRDMLNEIRRVLPEGETVPFQTLARPADFTAKRQGNEVIFTIKGKKDKPNDVTIDFAEFQEVLCLLRQKTDGVEFGNIQKYVIGHANCTVNTIDGHIAHFFYGIPKGGTHTRRATYIAPVLSRAELIKHHKGSGPQKISLNGKKIE